MRIHLLPAGPIQANCCLVRADASPQGVVIDPGGDAAAIAAECEAMSMVPAAILLTHGHFDHVGGVRSLLERFPHLPVYLHKADYQDLSPQLYPLKTQLEGLPGRNGPRFYSDGDVLTLAELPFRVIHTPGHTPGSVCLQCGGALFTGDTLFRGSVGRTDLPGGDPQQLTASLRTLRALEGDYTVYPGHDRPTTLDRERSQNPYLQEAMDR